MMPSASTTVSSPRPNVATTRTARSSAGNASRRVERAHDDGLALAAVVAGDEPQRDAHDAADDDDHERAEERRRGPVDDAGEDVAAGLVGAQGVLRGWATGATAVRSCAIGSACVRSHGATVATSSGMSTMRAMSAARLRTSGAAETRGTSGTRRQRRERRTGRSRVADPRVDDGVEQVREQVEER